MRGVSQDPSYDPAALDALVASADEPATGISVVLAHLSDSHLGYEAYSKLAGNGNNQRSVDAAKSFVAAADQIIAEDPPLVIHSGDLAERPQVGVRWMLLARATLAKLASNRPDGTRRQVVVIAGNHDEPSRSIERCWLELACAGLPGVTVVAGEARRITFEGDGLPAELADVEVVAVPHHALATIARDGFEHLMPTEGKLSILTAHGVAGGSSLFRRAIGREHAIPTDLLAAGWAYAALGHWHRRGPIDGWLGSRAYYAGSTENFGFGDLRENGQHRGWYQVTASTTELPVVAEHNVSIRPMLREYVEATGLTPDETTDKLLRTVAHLRDRGRLDGAICGVVVTGIGRDLWRLVDTVRVRDLASDAFHFELVCQPPRANPNNETGEGDESGSAADVAAGGDAAWAAMWAALNERAPEVLAGHPAERVAEAVSAAKTILTRELAVTVTDDTDGDADGGTGKTTASKPAEAVEMPEEQAA